MSPVSPARQLRWRVTHVEDAIWSGAEVRRIARLIGFDERACAEIGIAMGELVTNAAKYGNGGDVQIDVLEAPHPGIRITVDDDGPGIPDVETALKDGYSEGHSIEDHPPDQPRRGLGAGLGAVQRLMDKLRIEPRTEGGTQITAQKNLPPNSP